MAVVLLGVPLSRGQYIGSYLRYLSLLVLCVVAGCLSPKPVVSPLDLGAVEFTDTRVGTDLTNEDVGSIPSLAVDGAMGEAGVSLDGVLASTDVFAVLINGDSVSPEAVVALGHIAQHTMTFVEFEISNLGSLPLSVVMDHDVGLRGLQPSDLSVDVAPGQRQMIRLELMTDRENNSLSIPVSLDINGAGHQRLAYTLNAVIEPYIRDVAPVNRAFNTALNVILSEAGLVGLAAAVVRGTEIIALEGVGFADRESAVRVDPRITRFRWASVAKSMGAVVALRHIDIDIDAPVNQYLEGYEVPDSYLANGCDQLGCATPLQAEARRVTLRQLLSHRGGIQHYSNGVINPTPPRSAVNDPRVNDGIEWATDYFLFNPLVAIPGSAFKYSSFGYNLMGVVLEHALGDTYENLVQMHVGAVLGMQTLSADRFWEAVPNRAVGYRFSGGAAIRDGNTDVSWKLPGGGFISTVVDLARYCGGLQSEVLLSTQRREGTLWHDHFQQNYALGFALGTSGGRRLISHTGAQQKAASSLRLYPDEGVCIVVMSNTRPDVTRVDYDSAGAIGRQVDSAWRLLEQDAQQ